MAGDTELWLRSGCGAAGFEDALDAAPPCFDLTGAEEGIGHRGIANLEIGGMKAETATSVRCFFEIAYSFHQTRLMPDDTHR